MSIMLYRVASLRGFCQTLSATLYGSSLPNIVHSGTSLCSSSRGLASGLSATVIPGRGPNFRPTRSPLTLTQAAVDRIKAALVESGSSAKGLRIGVRTRGCNGLSYTLEYASEKGAMDETVVQDGVTIYIDRKAQLTLLGTEMDYVKGPLVSEFVFYNPNAKGTCGCGESFNV